MASESDASFTSGDEDEDSEEQPCPSGGSDDDDAADDGANPSKKPSIAARLKRVKSAFPVVDGRRSLEWTQQQVGAMERRLRSEVDGLGDLSQPRALKCTLHAFQLIGVRWLAALHACGLNGILADESTRSKDRIRDIVPPLTPLTCPEGPHFARVSHCQWAWARRCRRSASSPTLPRPSCCAGPCSSSRPSRRSPGGLNS